MQYLKRSNTFDRLSIIKQRHNRKPLSTFRNSICSHLLVGLMCCSLLWGAASTPRAYAAYEEQWINITLNTRFKDLESDYGSLMSPSYLDNGFQHLWLDASGQPNNAAQALIKLVIPFTELAEQHPWLTPYQEFIQRARQPIELPLPRHLLATDLLFSDMFARIQQDLASERFIRADSDQDHEEYRYGAPGYRPDRPDMDSWQQGYQLQLKTASTLPDQDRIDYLIQQIEQLYPRSSQSKALLSALDYWRPKQLENWPRLPAGKTLIAGAIRPDWVPLLIEQLQKLELLSPDYSPELENRYDNQLVDAVKRLQAQHGQKVDGIIGPNTRRVLNMTPQDRVRQLAHNFRRLYHLPQQMGERYVMINMASYQLQLMEQGQESLSMKVIVGTPKSRTPIMTQTMTSVILSPRWNVPKGIAARLIFPNAKANPDYLRQRNIIVLDGWSQPARQIPLDEINFHAYDDPEQFPYRFVQLPGNANLLGYVKFRLSNNKAIYMHDTPGKHLFDKTQRALSNGCIRLENALQLADHLLSDYWNQDRIQSVLHSGKETFLKTAQTELPVYLMYWTVWQDEEGNLQWRDDIYRKDKLPAVSDSGPTLLATNAKQDSEG